MFDNRKCLNISLFIVNNKNIVFHICIYWQMFCFKCVLVLSLQEMSLGLIFLSNAMTFYTFLGSLY